MVVKGRLAAPWNNVDVGDNGVHVPKAEPEAASKSPERKAPIVLKSTPPEVSLARSWLAGSLKDGHLSGDSWAIEDVGVGNPIKGPTGRLGF